ncbi:hypothetical protein MIR68_004665 [Amoeboaphelidium protococcarum]|nr:hypothetical protein MIR68_004665 [Amoeboaphelidium protococcarum]
MRSKDQNVTSLQVTAAADKSAVTDNSNSSNGSQIENNAQSDNNNLLSHRRVSRLRSPLINTVTVAEEDPSQFNAEGGDLNGQVPISDGSNNNAPVSVNGQDHAAAEQAMAAPVKTKPKVLQRRKRAETVGSVGSKGRPDPAALMMEHGSSSSSGDGGVHSMVKDDSAKGHTAQSYQQQQQTQHLSHSTAQSSATGLFFQAGKQQQSHLNQNVVKASRSSDHLNKSSSVVQSSDSVYARRGSKDSLNGSRNVGSRIADINGSLAQFDENILNSAPSTPSVHSPAVSRKASTFATDFGQGQFNSSVGDVVADVNQERVAEMSAMDVAQLAIFTSIEDDEKVRKNSEDIARQRVHAPSDVLKTVNVQLQSNEVSLALHAPSAASDQVQTVESSLQAFRSKQQAQRLSAFCLAHRGLYKCFANVGEQLIQSLEIQFGNDNVAYQAEFYPKDGHVKYENDTVSSPNTTNSGSGKVLRAATLSSIISHIVDSSTFSIATVKQFIATYAYHSDAIDVARLLILKYFECMEQLSAAGFQVSSKGLTQATMLKNVQKTGFNQVIVQCIEQQQNVIATLSYWIQNQASDFERHRMLCKLVTQFIGEVVEKEVDKFAIIKDSYNVLLTLQNWTFQSMKDQSVARDNPFRQLLVNNNVNSIQGPNEDEFVSILEVDINALATELSLIEHDSLKRVQHHELLHQCWSLKDKNLRELLAPNLLFFVSWFNRIAYGVASQVVLTRKLSDRVEVIKRFIQVAFECVKMRNYNSCFEIVAGLNMGSVSRMKHTWKALPKKYSDAWLQLNALVSSEGNYKVYRNTIAMYTNSGVPMVPYLGMYLSDLTFVEDGNPVYSSESDLNAELEGAKIVNYTRCIMLANVFQQIRSMQSISYKLLSNEDVRQYLATQWKILSEAQMYAESKISEPKDDTRGGAQPTLTNSLLAGLSIRGSNSPGSSGSTSTLGRNIGSGKNMSSTPSSPAMDRSSKITDGAVTQGSNRSIADSIQSQQQVSEPQARGSFANIKSRVRSLSVSNKQSSGGGPLNITAYTADMSDEVKKRLQQLN